MKPYKNYNIFALRGDKETPDVDVCANLGLDPKLAGTPEINEAAIRKMHKGNYEGYLKKGYSPDEALSLADANADGIRQEIKKLS